MKIKIVKFYSTEIILEIQFNDTYDYLYLKEIGQNKKQIVLDKYSPVGNISVLNSIKKMQNNLFKINFNKLSLKTLLNKNFLLETTRLVEEDGKNVEESVEASDIITITPDLNKPLLNYATKFEYDFMRLMKFKGSDFFLIKKNPFFVKNEEGFDPDIGEVINTSFMKSDDYVKFPFSGNVLAQQTKDLVTDQGTKIIKHLMVVTFDKYDFKVGDIFYYQALGEFYSIKDINISTIGNYRTSTKITGVYLTPEDGRIKFDIDIIPEIDFSLKTYYKNLSM